MALCLSNVKFRSHIIYVYSSYNFLEYVQTFLAVESAYILSLMAKPQFTKLTEVELHWSVQGQGRARCSGIRVILTALHTVTLSILHEAPGLSRTLFFIESHFSNVHALYIISEYEIYVQN